ncbi:hypothetical protein [Kineococcus esterisolvens]|uniref:hypothetical protein n=1 Tax=unclassified Kineococcus TaxID=2621656 RepID=UPI003D7EFBD8
MSAGPYFYDTRTGEVQDDEHRAPARYLLGPYATREEAARAPELARARTEAEDRRDEEEEDDW